MYDPREVLKRSPNEISSAIVVTLNTLVLTGVLSMSEKVLGGVNIWLAMVLSLFYVKQSTVNRTGLEQVQAAETAAFDKGMAVAPNVENVENVDVTVEGDMVGAEAPADAPVSPKPRRRRRPPGGVR